MMSSVAESGDCWSGEHRGAYGAQAVLHTLFIGKSDSRQEPEIRYEWTFRAHEAG